MRDYKLSNKYLNYNKNVPSVLQGAYYRNGYVYKVNEISNEGFVEYVVSRLLKCTDIPDELIINYEYCKINGRIGSRSKDFLQSNEVFININTLCNKLLGVKDLRIKLLLMRNLIEIRRMLYSICAVIGSECKVDYKRYLDTILQLDLITDNNGRGTESLGVIYNKDKGTFRLPPILCNGTSLGTGCLPNRWDYTIGHGLEMKSIIYGQKTKGDPTVYFKKAFTINLKELNKELLKIRKKYGYTAEVEILIDSIVKYGEAFM